MNKRGLGRGLNALLGEEKPRVAGAALAIPIGAITPNPSQPRSYFAPEALADLAASIKELGVVVPIIVRTLAPGKYELIAGERRWRAAAAAGLAEIPAIVREADARESLEVAIVENLQRENLDPLEEAMGFQHLMEAYAFTQERVAERMGKSRPAVANALRLLALPDAIKAHIRAGRLTAGHARALLALPEAKRIAAGERAAAEGMSVRALEALAHEKPQPKAKPAAAGSDADRRTLVERLRYHLGTGVAIVPAERGGRIDIRFADEADLIRIVDILVGEAS
jgi:ParB family chromosome partitioning protein